MNSISYPTIMQVASYGGLQINVTNRNGYRPIENASIQITETGVPDSVVGEFKTDSEGQVTGVQLRTPPIDLSLEPSVEQPYAEYNFNVRADGFEPVVINGAELLADVTALQEVSLTPVRGDIESNLYVIPPHTLFGYYPPKIAESEIKDLSERGEIVLSRVVIPEYVVVHDGPPSDSTAENYYVKYRDYIKNVASSEIYATWPESTIQANILAILSFTLNRVYTEWYRNKGYSFTITSSTAFDHKWIPGRNIFTNISQTVDTIFSNFLSRPNVKQPILTQYCDGKRVSCPDWMSQWGSKTLGDQGNSPIEIIRYYYGENMYINTAEEISGIPSSWPGSDLTIGSTGQKVQQMQEQINVIAGAYPKIPRIAADGIFGNDTANAVRIFQQVFGLPATGIVDYPTWFKISEIYVGVSRIAELN